MCKPLNNETIAVTVLDRETQSRAWGHGGGGLVLRMLSLPRYTRHGERRSDPTMEAFNEDGEYVAVSRWTLSSGRIESYAEAIAEAG